MHGVMGGDIPYAWDIGDLASVPTTNVLVETSCDPWTVLVTSCVPDNQCPGCAHEHICHIGDLACVPMTDVLVEIICDP